jgi:hypothetical protein
MTSSKIGIHLLIPILLFLVTLQYYSFRNKVVNLPLHADEMVWVGRGFYLDVFLKGDVFNPLWRTEKIDGDPRLSSYLFGAWIYPRYLHERTQGSTMLDYMAQNYVINSWYIPGGLDGKIDPIPLTPQRTMIEWDNYRDKNFEKEHLYSEYGEDIQLGIDLIQHARGMSALFLAGSVIVFYFILIRLFGNPILAILLSVLYGFSELIITSGLAANTEGFFLFFFLLAILGSLHIVLKDARSYRWYVALGIILGCLNQIKLNGIIVAVVFNVCFIILKLFGKLSKANVKRLVITNIIFVVVNVGLNPTAYYQPLKFTHFQYAWTLELAKAQTTWFPYQHLDTLTKRVSSIDQALFPPQYYPKYGINSQWFYSQSYNGIVKTFAGLGIVSLLLHLVFLRESSIFKAHFVVIIVVLATVGSLLLSYVLAWPRYLVHLVPVVLISIGYSVNGLSYAVKQFFRILYAKT